MIDPARLKAYFTDLQTHIVTALETLEGSTGASFRADPWEKEADSPLAGSGCTCILEGGRIFERGGVAFSQVSGAALPASATAKRPELAGRAFAAMGVSLVLHPAQRKMITSSRFCSSRIR
jgi:coproporphyrinogen III oxidase